MPSSARSTVLTTALAVAAVAAFAAVAVRSRSASVTLNPATTPNAFVGRDAPDFVLPSLDGSTVQLSDLRGRVVVLDLWATWCPPCVAELPINAAVTKKYADRGVAFYAINLGEPAERVSTFLDKHGIDATVLLDAKGDTAVAYDARYIPLLVVIDANGRIVGHDNLAPDEVEGTLTKWIESAVASGQAVGRGSERPATRP